MRYSFFDELRNECVGGMMTPYLNDQQTTRARDADFASGGMEVVAYDKADEAPGVEVACGDFAMSGS